MRHGQGKVSEEMEFSGRGEAGPSPRAVLKEIYGFDVFRPDQEGIVAAILAGRDAFVVMPTGGGKSLCYQLPAHMLDGTCLVVSPLISLMKDQVDAAVATGLRAAYLNSSQSSDDRRGVVRRLLGGQLDLLYVSPERFAMESFIDCLGRARLSFVAIDEAHCISEWGHDFRPDYLNLARIAPTFPGVAVCAFTATATLRVQEDIIAKLALRAPYIVRASFNRPNLFYRVEPKRRAERQVLEFVRQHAGESGIIYRMTRRSVESMAEYLSSNGIKALPYHAGLADDVRAKNQDAFNRDEAEVVVATIAFGMGIDKSDVRYVLHGDIPKNLEGYYQETGRAGRDGEPATCLLLFGRGDIPRIRYFVDQVEDEQERKHALRCLNEMAAYAGTHACRRRQLLAYFGERYPDAECGACDVCTGGVEKTDATRDAQIVLSAILRTKERFGATHIVDVVTGADTQRIRRYGHDAIRTYGVGRGQDKSHWRMILDNLLAQGFLAQTDDQYPVLRLTESAREVLFHGRAVYVIRHDASPAVKKAARAGVRGDPGLFEALRVLRKRRADERGVPPFVIFSDRSLQEMAHFCPTNDEEMSRISGVGNHKLASLGGIFAEAIARYLAGHPEVEKPKVAHPLDLDLAPAKPARRPTTEVTWELAQKSLSLKDIAGLRGLTATTICQHLEALMCEGKAVDIDRYVDPARREQIEGLFRQIGTGKLSPVIEASGGTVTFEEARLVRAHLQRAGPASEGG